MGAGRVAGLVVVLVAACSEGGGDLDPNLGDSNDADASVPDGCPDADLGEVGQLEPAEAFQFGQDISDPDGPQVRTLVGDLGPGIHLMLFVWDGRGLFVGGGAETGTFALGEPIDDDPETCGICLSIAFGDDEESMLMEPASGSLTFDSIEGVFIGSASDVLLEQSAFPGQGDAGPVGCTGAIASFAFEAPLQD